MEPLEYVISYILAITPVWLTLVVLLIYPSIHKKYKWSISERRKTLMILGVMGVGCVIAYLMYYKEQIHMLN